MDTFQLPTGYTFSCSQYLPLITLVQDLRKLAGFLQSVWTEPVLNRFDDWWQHDGLHFYKGRITFHTLFTVLDLPRALYEAMPGDQAVRIGVAPLHSEWYLRFYADWDDDGEHIEGDYDLTLPAYLSQRLRTEVQPTLQAVLTQERAEVYFQTIIG